MLLLCLLIALQDPVPEPSAEHWATQWRSDKAADRDQASERLKSMGKAALAVLEPLLKDKDPEVADRARVLVEELRRDAPAVTLLKLEEKLLKAKTVRLTLELRSGTDDDKVLKGEILAKEGGKVRFWLVDPKGGSPVNIRLTSDGTNAQIDSGKSVRIVKTPPNLIPDLLTGLVRAGALPTLTALTNRSDGLGKMLKARSEEIIHAGPPSMQLRYDLYLGEQRTPYKHSLACRPEQGVLLSRKVLTGGILLEQYGEMQLDEDIPDSKFALPEK